ncbi:RNA polymerase recycling motor HelD [Alkaliphilus peptidifermentans]|uniref:DNA helicase-2 / ATP-dependent DNA helicase PcrA n=1 Tax=Alkaliphilus peptidifermentans DSM 18978 TaxID=1120976 RepID=A0A1G5IVG9_9FIRM|nr:RNA polymerase recycling motor HelD [Alkaliphilus peptidifermentans]SCY79710.1 DNA helicase-2 / ATP-dependent DNA helicase PcrA [Alkaliphilus peptidifermentans DSM 18978]
MPVKGHPDYKQEVERLEHTKEYIEKTLDATEEYRKLYKENIKDAMINLDYLDSSQSYISVLINTKFIEMADRNFESLSRSRKKPYFSRIDFKEKGSNKTDKLYIGKTSLFRAEDSVPLIVDWRAPIANVYYEGRLGETTYEAEGVTQEGELLLKRQYTIEEGELKDILDVDITTNDAFLQASLEANAEEKLKDIASTIQAEQNRVIRADMGKPLIVQGVAGSGKTTIALHRIAYFIYTYEKTFHPESFMIMAPNKLFINYISEVLPELGVEKVKQTTFIDFMVELLGNKYKMVSSENKLMEFIRAGTHEASTKEQNLVKWATAFKGSMDFKAIIDNYVKTLELNFTPKEDFIIENLVIMTADSINSMFIEELGYLPLYKRVNEIKKTLTYKFKQVKKGILENTEERFDRELERLRNTGEATEERRLKIVDLINKRDDKLKALKNQTKTLVKKYIAKFPKVDLFDYYSELMSNGEVLNKYSNDQLPQVESDYLCQKTKELLLSKKVELEDYAALVYLKHKIFGFEKKIDINSIVIDEAQDFSVFQIYTLKTVLNTNMFTLLGDISQGIHSYRGIQNWEQLLEHVFDAKRSNYMTLVQSYRTTIEVMQLANEIIRKLNNPQIVLAKPVIRHGEKPEARSFKDENSLLNELEEKILFIQRESFKSIAVICKTKEECLRVKKRLDEGKKINAKLLDEKEEIYEAGVVLVPSHLAKGLEFDVVLITNLKEQYRDNELDIKLLYVAMTRALHRLYIYHIENKMPLMDNIGEELLKKSTDFQKLKTS